MDFDKIHLDKNSSKPLYIQLYDAIALAIENGTVVPGEKLPTKRTLANKTGISYNTVINTYDALIRNGLVISAERKGFFVAGSPDEEMFKGTPWVLPDARKYIFSINGNGINRLSKKFIRAIHDTEYELQNKLLSYKEPTGHTELREKICEYLYNTRHIICTPDQVILGCGYKQLMDIAATLLGDNLIYALENPGNRKIAEGISLHRNCCYINASIGGTEISALKKSSADVFVCAPEKQTPLAYTMDMRTRFELVDWAEQGKFIIEHGIYCDFAFSVSFPSIYSLSGGKNVIYINSFEHVSAPGLTLAYMVIPENLIYIFKQKMPLYQCNVSEFDSLLALEYITNKGIYSCSKRLKNLYLKKCTIAINEFKKLSIADKLRLYGTEVGAHFCIEVLTDKSPTELSTLLKIYGIKMLRISHFCLGDSIEEPVFIFGYAEPSEADIIHGIHLIGEAWKEI